MARKPLAGTVAATVLAHGTGGLNVDACRVGMSDADRERLTAWHGKYGNREYNDSPIAVGKGLSSIQPPNTAGRWPANVVLTHAPDCADLCVDGCPVAELDAQSGTTKSSAGSGVVRHGRNNGIMGEVGALRDGRPEGHNDEGGASRFFPTFRYQAKAPTKERPKVDGVAHPTVKPLALMAWLVRLVTPPGGTVLDPFAGSGTTGEAAELEGFNAVLIERDPTYLPLIEQRRARKQADTSGDQLTLVGG